MSCRPLDGPERDWNDAGNPGVAFGSIKRLARMPDSPERESGQEPCRV